MSATTGRSFSIRSLLSSRCERFMPARRLIETPHGTAGLLQRRSPRPWATLVLTHGAGGGIDSPDLLALAGQLPRHGITVARIEQPWRVSGRRVAAAPGVLDDGFIAAMSALRPQTPLILGGRSAGARVACRTGRKLGAAGIVALAFPLHPAGRPEKTRVHELLDARLPSIVVQGERDLLGAPYEFPPRQSVVAIPGADHQFRVPALSDGSQQEALDLIVGAVLAWIQRRLRHA